MNTVILTGGNTDSRSVAAEEILKKWHIQPLYTIQIIKNEEKQSIGVEEVRETLSHVSLLPPLNENQCLYIRDMDILTPEAMNALLKTIEEPPSRTFILLASANADAILPTIRSRCQTILLKSEKLALTTEEEKEYQKNLAILTAGDIREKLMLLKKYLKHDDALVWIDTFLPFIQSKILTNEVQTNEDVSLVKIASLAKRLLEARDLLNRNINPILVMDSLALM
ncbi:MAG: hypothetical protein AAB508_02595 [Patescibacteria group bacterium]